MASTPMGDIAGAKYHQPNVLSNASVASNGANARLGQIGPFAFPIRMRNAWWSPTGADQAATQTATYRQISLYNGGTSGTVTATATATSGGGRLASLNLIASQASLGAMAMTVDTTVTLASGQIAYFSQATVGGTDANGTVMVAGQFAIAYEVL